MIFPKTVRFVLFTLTLYASHYSIVRAYTYFCIPSGFAGFIQGLLTTGNPICRGLLELITKTDSLYAAIILSTFTFLLESIRV